MREPIQLEYAPKVRISRLAVASMIAGIVGLVLFPIGIPALLALIFSFMVGNTLDYSSARLGGAGYVKTGKALSAAGLFFFLLWILFVPGTHGCRCLSRRSYCAANLTGILKSANVYASDFGNQFPIVPYAPYTAALNNPRSGAALPTATDAIGAVYTAPPPDVAGSPMASLWLLVLTGYCAPKQFACKDDPTGAIPMAFPGGKSFPTNFSSGATISYSVAYPWTVDGNVGGWWKPIVAVDLPLMSDIAPLDGTGSPARTLATAVAPGTNARWNSINHRGDGQTIGWSDAHASFERRPDIGQSDDNIFTTSGTGLPQKFGGTPATPLFPPIPNLYVSPGAAGPFDVIMVPVRNATTGAM